MARKDDSVSLEDVRTVAEMLRSRKPDTEVSARGVIDILQRGSAGVVNAYLKQVKVEWIRAEKYNLLDISPELKAAIYAEVVRAARDADNAARRECGVTEYHFKKIVEANHACERQIQALEAEVAAIRRKSAEKISQLETALAETRGRLAVSEELRSSMARERDAVKDLEDRLSEMHQERSELEARIADLNERFSKSETRAAVAESRLSPRDFSFSHQPPLFNT